MPVIVASTTSKTLGDLKTRIADELARADLAPQIALAITDAIAEASTHRFWFMEVRGLTIPLTAGTANYTSDDVAGLIEIDRLALITGGQRRTLRAINDDELDRMNDGTPPQGEPYAYARYGDQLRLYPTPRQTYTVSIDGLWNGGALILDTDSNIWTTSGERYIRTLAKRDISANLMHDMEAAVGYDKLAQRYREELQQQTHARTATNEVASYG